jgi:hypothetical protein
MHIRQQQGNGLGCMGHGHAADDCSTCKTPTADDCPTCMMPTASCGRLLSEELWRHLGQLGVQQEDQGPNQFGRKGAHDVLAHMERAR